MVYGHRLAALRWFAALPRQQSEAVGPLQANALLALSSPLGLTLPGIIGHGRRPTLQNRGQHLVLTVKGHVPSGAIRPYNVLQAALADHVPPAAGAPIQHSKSALQFFERALETEVPGTRPWAIPL